MALKSCDFGVILFLHRYGRGCGWPSRFRLRLHPPFGRMSPRASSSCREPLTRPRPATPFRRNRTSACTCRNRLSSYCNVSASCSMTVCRGFGCASRFRLRLHPPPSDACCLRLQRPVGSRSRGRGRPRLSGATAPLPARVAIVCPHIAMFRLHVA